MGHQQHVDAVAAVPRHQPEVAIGSRPGFHLDAADVVMPRPRCEIRPGHERASEVVGYAHLAGNALPVLLHAGRRGAERAIAISRALVLALLRNPVSDLVLLPARSEVEPGVVAPDHASPAPSKPLASRTSPRRAATLRFASWLISSLSSSRAAFAACLSVRLGFFRRTTATCLARRVMSASLVIATGSS